MTDLRLPAELEASLQREAEALALPVADFVQMLLQTWQLGPAIEASQIPERFTAMLEAAESAHAGLFARQELWP